MTGAGTPPDSAGLYDELAGAYDQTVLGLFPFVADHLLGHLRPRRGGKLLDVGAGTGAVALAAAPMLAPQGRVTAVDVSEGMLARLQAKAERMGLDNVDVHVMDAAALEFRRHYFDAVTASFVLCQLPDPAAALAHWLRVLKPGGQLVVTTLGGGAFAPVMADLVATLADLGVPLAAEPFVSAERTRHLLQQAGAAEIDVAEHDFGYHLAGAEEWWRVIWASGLLPQIHALDGPTLGQLRRRHLDRIAERAGTDGIQLSIPVNIGRARAG